MGIFRLVPSSTTYSSGLNMSNSRWCRKGAAHLPFRHALSTKLQSGVHPKVVWTIWSKKVNLALGVYDRTDVADFVQPLSLVVNELCPS